MGNCLANKNKNREPPNTYNQNSRIATSDISQEYMSFIARQPLRPSHQQDPPVRIVRPQISPYSLESQIQQHHIPNLSSQQISDFLKNIRQSNHEQCRSCSGSYRSGSGSRSNRSRSSSSSNSNNGQNIQSSGQKQIFVIDYTQSALIGKQEESALRITHGHGENQFGIAPTISIMIDMEHRGGISKLPKPKKKHKGAPLQQINSQIVIGQTKKKKKLHSKKSNLSQKHGQRAQSFDQSGINVKPKDKKKDESSLNVHQNIDQSVIIVKTRVENRNEKSSVNIHQNIEQSVIIVKTREDKKNDNHVNVHQNIAPSAITVKPKEVITPSLITVKPREENKIANIGPSVITVKPREEITPTLIIIKPKDENQNEKYLNLHQNIEQSFITVTPKDENKNKNCINVNQNIAPSVITVKPRSEITPSVITVKPAEEITPKIIVFRPKDETKNENNLNMHKNTEKSAISITPGEENKAVDSIKRTNYSSAIKV